MPELASGSDVDFVESVCRDLGGLAPDRSEIERCVHLLDSGQKSREEIASEMCQEASRLVSASVPSIDRERLSYSCGEFLRYSGVSFVAHLVRSLTKREPTGNELSRYWQTLRSGEMSRIELIREVGRSIEARVAGVGIWDLEAQHPRFGELSPLASPQVSPVDLQTTTYRLQELVAVPDDVFLQNLYRCLLKREPDPQGAQTYISLWLSGAASNADIIYSLATSPEARASGVRVTGLRMTGIRRTLASLPLIGFVFETVAWLLHLPQLGKNVQQLHHRNRIALEQLKSEMGGSRESVQNRMVDSAREAVALAAQVTDIAGQQQELRSAQRSLRESVEALRLVSSALENSKADRDEFLVLLDGKVDSERLNEVSERKADLNFVEDLNLRLANLSEHKADRKFVDDLCDQKVDLSAVSALAEQQLNLQTALHALKLRSLDMDRRLSLILEETRKRFPEPIQQDQANAMLMAGRGLLDALYSEFEDIFRGTREDIKARQTVYFSRILGIPKERHSRALDIGCGRGEFLELLTEHGFTATGVELNETMVGRCRDLGLNVQHADAIDFLKSQPAGSLSLISAFHVVEHLPHQHLIALLDEALRTLAPQGVLILETPNPKNLLVASCNFYMDPTHLNPIPDQLLRFIVEARGFVNPEVIPLHPVPDYARPRPGVSPDYLNELLFGPQDYGVIAWKA